MKKEVRARLSGYVRSRGCAVSQQFVNATTCLARDVSQLLCGSRVNAVHPVRHGRLTHANSFRECRLGRIRPVQVGAQRLHRPKGIGLPYDYAIGSPYGAISQNWSMAKLRERTFLERALDALKERYPKDRATQTRLAKIAGVSQPAVYEWGLPNRAPEHPSVLKLAKELNVCVEWLYTERGPRHPPVTAEAEPFLQDWEKLDPETRRQIARYADFVKTENTKQ